MLSSNSKAFLLESYCACSFWLSRRTSLSPPWMLAVCHQPVLCAAPEQRMSCSMWCFSSPSTGFSAATLWGCREELALLSLQVPATFTPSSAVSQMDSKPAQSVTRTHMNALTYTRHQDYKSALYISQPSGLMPAEI